MLLCVSIYSFAIYPDKYCPESIKNENKPIKNSCERKSWEVGEKKMEIITNGWMAYMPHVSGKSRDSSIRENKHFPFSNSINFYSNNGINHKYTQINKG